MTQPLNAAVAKELLSQLRDVFELAVGAYALLTEEPARSELSEYFIRYDDMGRFQATKTEPRPTDWVLCAEVRFRNVNYQVAAAALLERSKRQAIIESFDIVRRFAFDTPAWKELAAEPWYHFVRLYRHAVAHDGHWLFKEKELAILPASFMNLRIDASMDGLSIEGFIDLFRAGQLLRTMYLFIDGHRGRQ